MQTNITWLWVSAVVFAHLFAGFWLVKTVLLNNPQALACCGRRKKRKNRVHKGAGGAPAAIRDNASPRSAPSGVVVEIRPRPARAALSQAWSLTLEGCALSTPCATPRANGGSACGSDSLYGSSAGGGSGGAKPTAANELWSEPLELEWQDVGCSYRTPAGAKVVLQEVYGRAGPGEMQALLGPSGAGKSTLMDILAQRKSVGALTGRVLASGRPVGRAFVRRAAYVPQDDNFVPTMSTAEVMRFYARLVLPEALGRAGRLRRVDEVLDALGLRSHAATLVGGSLPGGMALRGLSGGERKRLSIAAGILAAPSVVFLDEPTSGLDSFSALAVMGYMRRAARSSGQVVIASIHQPRSAIWSMFDTVTLLSSGRLMYTGPREGMTQWFLSRGHRYDAALHGVASDWALDLVAIGFHKPKRFYGHSIRTREQLMAASAAFVARYLEEQAAAAAAAVARGGGGRGGGGGGGPRGAASVQCSAFSSSSSSPFANGGGSPFANDGGGGRGGSPAPSRPPSRGAPPAPGARGPAPPPPPRLAPLPPPAWPTGWWVQYGACLGRELLAVTRNPADAAGRTLTFSWVALLMGLLYFNMPLDASSLRGRMNLLFNGLVFFCLMPYVSMSLYTADKRFYRADAGARLYRPHAYYAAKATATLPFQVLSALIFAYTVYGMAGLRPGFIHILQNGTIASLMYAIAVQVLHCCALLAPNQDTAFMCSILWSTVQLLMSNFFITYSDLRFKWLQFLKWFSALYYSFEGLAVVEFGGATFDCSRGLDPTGVTFLKQLLPNTKFLNLAAVTRALLHPGADCVADTDAVLRYYTFWRPFKDTVAILAAYYAATHVATYAVMVLVARRERR